MPSKTIKSERIDVRIVAGTLRGRKISCVVHDGMRPTPQMVREALFSILGNAVPGRVFFDVFAGTGVVGLEAISRGATTARLIEKDPQQAIEIQKCQSGPNFLSSRVVTHPVVLHINTKSLQANAGQPKSF